MFNVLENNQRIIEAYSKAEKQFSVAVDRVVAGEKFDAGVPRISSSLSNRIVSLDGLDLESFDSKIKIFEGDRLDWTLADLIESDYRPGHIVDVVAARVFVFNKLNEQYSGDLEKVKSDKFFRKYCNSVFDTGSVLTYNKRDGFYLDVSDNNPLWDVGKLRNNEEKAIRVDGVSGERVEVHGLLFVDDVVDDSLFWRVAIPDRSLRQSYASLVSKFSGKGGIMRVILPANNKSDTYARPVWISSIYCNSNAGSYISMKASSRLFGERK